MKFVRQIRFILVLENNPVFLNKSFFQIFYHIYKNNYLLGVAMEILEFKGEGIKFQYLSNWREQDKAAIGPNCILSLVRVLEGNPSTITVSKNDAGEVVAIASIQEQMEKNFEGQGWNIVDSKILNLNGNPVLFIVADAEDSGRVLENKTTFIIKNGFMYIFELMHFKEFPHAYDDYLNMLNSLEFIN